MNRRHLRGSAFQLLERSSPGDLPRVVFDIALITLIAANVVAVIFESVDAVYRQYATFFQWFEIVSVAIFTVEYAARVWCSVEHPARAHRALTATRIRLRHIRSLPAIVDLVAILPFYLLQLGLLGTMDLRFVRALRLLRIFKITRYSQTMSLLLTVLRDNARTLGAVFVMLFIVMIMAASGIYLFEHEAQPEAFGNIPAAMWWACVTLTAVGYGDVSPVTIGGKCFGALIMVIGVGMVAIPAGVLASAFSEQLRHRERFYKVAVDRALEDGVIDQTERKKLEATRVHLGLSPDNASTILAMEKQRARDHTGEYRVLACPHCGGSLEHGAA